MMIGWRGLPTPEATVTFVEEHRRILAPEFADLLIEALTHSPPLDRNLFCNGPYKMTSFQITDSYGDRLTLQVRREDSNRKSHVQGIMVDVDDDVMVTNISFGSDDLRSVCNTLLSRPDS